MIVSIVCSECYEITSASSNLMRWFVCDDCKYNPLSVTDLPMDPSLLSPPVTDPRAKKKYYFADTPQRRALILLARTLFLPVMKYDVTGLENFPREGAVIVAANHVTSFDVFPMQFAVSRVIFYMAKSELFKNPIMDLLMRNLSGFPVQRGEKDQWAMDHALKILRDGETLGMFPEGTRSREGGLKVAKTGTAKLAIETGSSIVPMAIVGSNTFFKKLPHRARVHIQILPPIMPTMVGSGSATVYGTGSGTAYGTGNTMYVPVKHKSGKVLAIFVFDE